MVEVPAARREEIAALVAEHGYVRVADLARDFGVSEVSIRSDLTALDGAGLVRRVHGGALAVAGPDREDPVESAMTRDARAKRAIGARAAALVAISLQHHRAGIPVGEALDPGVFLAEADAAGEEHDRRGEVESTELQPQATRRDVRTAHVGTLT